MATQKQHRKKVSFSRAHRRPAILLGLLLITTSPCSIGDAYLEMIEEEAKAVEMDPSLLNSMGGQSPVKASPTLGSRRAFEQELKQLYEGTYLFYEKLPERSREEVFIEYNQGASLEKVRETIIDRFLHSR